MKGTYILVLYLKEGIDATIGSLRKLRFPKGFYLYVGSAMGDYGSSTLINRVKRHLRWSTEKKIFWHIDYLLNSMHISINRIFFIPSLQHLECIIAVELSQVCDNSVRNFGSSDCNCPSHLFYFQNLKCVK
jgi:Uri superfamily endonuclease